MFYISVFLFLVGLFCFGIFFLIFKLIWILRKDKRNFWPLVISGALTGIIVLLGGLYSHHLYKQFVKPFDPVIQAAQTQTTPQEGQRIYNNPVGFAFTLHDGTTMSEWIKVEDWNFLAGIDTNIFINKNQSDQPFSLYLLGHKTNDKPNDVHQIIKEIALILEQNTSPKGRIVLEQVQPVDIGPNAAAELLTASIYPYHQNTTMSFSLILATKGTDIYFLGGMGNTGNEKVLDTVRSFSFTK